MKEAFVSILTIVTFILMNLIAVLPDSLIYEKPPIMNNMKLWALIWGCILIVILELCLIIVLQNIYESIYSKIQKSKD